MSPARLCAMLGVMALRCIIVDDSPGVLRAASDLLARQGVVVAGVASTGAEAVHLVKALAPDVSLVDIDLGDESGFELARRLSDEAGPPTILISTYDEADFEELIGASPAIGFLAKSDLGAEAITRLLATAGHGQGDEGC